MLSLDLRGPGGLVSPTPKMHHDCSLFLRLSVSTCAHTSAHCRMAASLHGPRAALHKCSCPWRLSCGSPGDISSVHCLGPDFSPGNSYSDLSPDHPAVSRPAQGPGDGLRTKSPMAGAGSLLKAAQDSNMALINLLKHISMENFHIEASFSIWL